MLTILCSNPDRKWSWDELDDILEPEAGKGDLDIDPDPVRRERKREKARKAYKKIKAKYYDRWREIRDRIATKTGVKEFLVFDTQNVRINPNYKQE